MMKDFLYFKDKMYLSYKSFVSSGVDFEKYRPNALEFIKYMGSDFDNNMKLYSSVIDMDSIQLENIIDAKYKFMFKGPELRNVVEFIQEVHKRLEDFKGKETNLKVMLGFYLIYFVIITKLVETYLSAVSTYNVDSSTDITTAYKLKDLGIDTTVLKYYVNFEDLRTKTIDEWLKVKIEPIEERFIGSAIKRILMILGVVSKEGTK
jgi:hypothetical protein